MTEPRGQFWNSAGMHLLARNGRGWLDVTPQFILAYLTRPEVHPIADSCAREIALHEDLVADPFLKVPEERLALLADADAADNYRVVLAFRDALVSAGTIEGAYLDLVKAQTNRMPPVFLDQLVHVILRNLLDGAGDPIRVKAAELLFRTQKVSLDEGRVMLADEEIVEMHAETGQSGLAQLLAETGTPMRNVSLDVLDADNCESYWARSDRFDMVVDFRFEQPALDAFARVLEMWILHLLGLKARIEPRPRIDDVDWRWHVGLDATATRLLNTLYEGGTLDDADASKIIGLFRMMIADTDRVLDHVKGRPIHLALAMDEDNVVRMKPQNLLVNLPLVAAN